MKPVLSCLFFMLSCCFLWFSSRQPMTGVLLAAAFLLVFVMCQKPMAGFCILILSLPFHGTDLMDSQLMGIPGLKLSSLIMVIVLLSFLFFETGSLISDRRDLLFLWGVLALFLTSVILSTRYIGQYDYWFWNEDYSVFKYLLSHWLKPVLMVIPFFILIKYIRSEKELERVFNYLIGSVLLLSVMVLYLYIFMTPNKDAFYEVRFNIGSYLGMHGNNIADFFIIAFPLVFMAALVRKKAFHLVTLILSVAAVAVLYSRSAYVAILLSTVLVLLLARKAKVLPILVVIVALMVILVPASVAERFQTGLDTMNPQEISAGRVEDIWLPAWNEIVKNPARLFFGSGKYGIMNTEAFESGAILPVGHAHNMYLDMILDSGLLGLIFFIACYAMYYRRTNLVIRILPISPMKSMIVALKIAIIAFLVRGFTDSFFFPALTNAYIWIILGFIGASCYIFRGESQEYLKEGERNEKYSLPVEYPAYRRG